MSIGDKDRERIAEEAKRAHSAAALMATPMPFLISLLIDPIDPLTWLSSSPAGEKWYWQSRDGSIEVAGTGAAQRIAVCAMPSLSPMLRAIEGRMKRQGMVFLCGRRFSTAGRLDTVWRGFPDELSVAPATMIVRRDSDYRLFVHRRIVPEAETETLVAEVDGIIRRIDSGMDSQAASDLPALRPTEHIPDRNGWEKNVRRALEAIDNGRIEKVVLARRTDYSADSPVNPVSLLQVLKNRHPGCYAMLYQQDAETAFLSLTPERLYRRVGGEISVDALSSTLPRGSSPDEDMHSERRLMNDDKLQREHQAVVDGVIRSLKPLCEQPPTAGERSVMKLARIQHLAVQITASVGKDVTDDQLIGALHPTPAVAGSPRAAATEIISRLEGFERGWYAAPFGIIADGEAEFAVGIRSALVRGDTVSVFSGAGIVRGSDPDSEWNEIESKDILRSLIAEKASP